MPWSFWVSDCARERAPRLLDSIYGAQQGDARGGRMEPLTHSSQTDRYPDPSCSPPEPFMFPGEPPADFLTAYLAAHDANCPACGYSLRNLKRGVCPECGEALTLRVGLVEPRMGLWIAGLVGLAAGA